MVGVDPTTEAWINRSTALASLRWKPWLVGVLVVVTVVADSVRAPAKQWTASLYIDAVHGYQSVGRPLVGRWIECRFRPTCSRYSIEAVRMHGIGRGLFLTAQRLLRCRRSIPLGTMDNVP